MENNKLTKEELNELVGGSVDVDEVVVLNPDDIINKNSYWGCTCTYKNTSAISNENTVTNCTCQCV